MTDDLNLETQKLRKQYIRSFNNDGLLDFFVGCSLLSTGLFLETSQQIYSIGGLLVLFIYPIKKWIVIPRWGYARFLKPSAVPKSILIGIGVIFIFIAFLRTFVFTDYEGFEYPIATAVIFVSLIIILVSGLNKIAFYAVFIPLLFIIGLGFGFLTPALVMLLGGLLMIFGISLFVSFLRANPLIEDKD